MKYSLVAVLFAAFLSFQPAFAEEKQASLKFISLIDPALSHFEEKDADKFWQVTDGVLKGKNLGKRGHYLWTKESFSDFILEFEAKWHGPTKRGADTGIEMRKPKIQLQLGISGSLRVDMTGSFYTGKYPEAGQSRNMKELMKPKGQWNAFRIQAKGNTFTCWINGKKASEYTDAKFSGAAPLAFQIHSKVEMTCEFRNARVARLDREKK